MRKDYLIENVGTSEYPSRKKTINSKDGNVKLKTSVLEKTTGEFFYKLHGE